jgi:Zn-dependent protease with chaperone function
MKLYLILLSLLFYLFFPNVAVGAAPTESDADGEKKEQPAQEEPSEPEKPPKDDSEAEKIPKKKPSPEQQAKLDKLAQADRLYLAGDRQAAAQIYREVKQPFTSQPSLSEEKPTPIYEPNQLSPSGAVYWRTYQEGIQQKLESKILAPLKLLVNKNPEFIPGHLHYFEALKQYQKLEEADRVLQTAISQYPQETDLLRVKIAQDDRAKKWIDASMTARHFALFNPEHPEAKEFTDLANQYLERYKAELNSDLTWNAIGNVVTGAAGFALTGNLFGPISAIETSVLLLRGESALGESYAKDAQEELPMLKDEEVLKYVNAIGQKLASVAGRNEFKYQFYLVMDDGVNAFALPGGKIFINAGTLMKTNSEAELAGLLAHELSHAVLSHSFQLITQGNLTANVIQYVPYVGGLGTDLIVFNYSRDMERQADSFGTRILASSGYAADGMYSLMNILKQEEKKKKKDAPPPAWLSTHPDADERIKNLENMIIKNNFDRYAYEGVTQHQKMQQKVQKLWREYQKTDEYKERHQKEEEEREEPLMQFF